MAVRRRALALRIGTVLLSATVALLAAEVALRLLRPHGTFRTGYELPWMHELDSAQRLFTPDPEMGFRPVVPSHAYDEHGLYRKRTEECAEDQPRLLFVGDSVTAGGLIQAALRACGALAGVCFLNAGVGSFNTAQELAFFTRYNVHAQPDAVILFFHLNDFESTPVVYRDRDGRLRVYATFLEERRVWPWLYARSYVYRLLLGLGVDRDAAERRIQRETLARLDQFAARARAEGVEFRVAVLPLFLPEAEWTPRHRERLRAVRAHLAVADIRHQDLVGTLEEAARAGVVPGAAEGRDAFHPSVAMAELMAARLCAEWRGTAAGHP